MKGTNKDRDMEGMKEFWDSIEKDQDKMIKLPREGRIRLSPKHSERMYRQNRNKYQYGCIMKMKGPYWDGNSIIKMVRLETISFPDSCEIEAWTIAVDKFTIVELICNGKHYHGLSAQANCDDDNVMTGIYNAYHRAFKSMIGL
ncbi:MAG: hypothetical protein KAJ93_01030 [Methanosarcinales archaeon]|nr:hypothetical protein [Methanosarcinales archaeon]